MATILPSFFAVTFLLSSAAAQNTTCGDTATATQQVLAELRSLRLELLQDLAERQAEKIELLAAEVERVRAQRIRIEQALQSHQNDTQNWSKEVQTAEYTPEERVQLQTAKAAVDLEASSNLSRRRQLARLRRPPRTAPLAAQR